jgi:hydrogenase nickel incorporation protein HypA/HybF
MHEAGIIGSMLDIAGEKTRESGAEGIGLIRMRIGLLTGVVEEALQHAFDVLKQETAAKNAELQVEYVPGRSWCVNCRKEFTADDLLVLCPDCGSPGEGILQGLEMELVSIDVF